DAQDLENAVKEVKKHWKTMVKDIQPKKKAKAKAKK
ncbi:MAG: hypothetical protein UR64_C0006G0001, partial [Candidatus Nomurabacteria bacterium GW2011_GWE1_35_16]